MAAYADSFATLDVEIGGVQMRMCAMREKKRALHERRNALTTFYRLPNDILYRVLHMVVRSAYTRPIVNLGGYPPRPTRFEPLEILDPPFDPSITWARTFSLCRRVRSLAIGLPLLWSNVNLGDSPEWIDLLLERAGTSPLFLAYYDSDHTQTAVKANFAGLIRHVITPTIRTRRVNEILTRSRDIRMVLAIPPGQNMGCIIPAQAASLPFSVLRAFNMVVSARYGGPVTLGSGFLADARSLTHLTMHYVVLEVDLSFPFLTYLELREVSFRDGGAHLLALIQSSIHMEHIHIQLAIDADTLSVVFKQPVQLSLLKTIDVEAMPWSMPTLLSVLPQPCHTHHLSSPRISGGAWGPLGTPVEVSNSDPGVVRVRPLMHALAIHRVDIRDILVDLRYDLSYIVSLNHKTASGATLHYKDFSHRISQFNVILERVHKLRVFGQAISTLFAYATQEAPGSLALVEEVQIVGEQSDPQHVFNWLRGRVSLGNMVNVVDFRDCEPIAFLAREHAGLAGTMMYEGNPV
jgi:hypothetical protein